MAADGTLYGTNTGAADRADSWVVWKVTPDGQPSIFVQGAPLNLPNGIEVDRNGNVVVVNVGTADVITFSPDGKVTRTEKAVQGRQRRARAYGRRHEVRIQRAAGRAYR